MLELLAPWAGQRQRVMRLIEVTGVGRRATARASIADIRAICRHPPDCRDAPACQRRAASGSDGGEDGVGQRGHASRAQSPKSRSASATSAEPGGRVDPEHRAALPEVAVRRGRVGRAGPVRRLRARGSRSPAPSRWGPGRRSRAARRAGPGTARSVSVGQGRRGAAGRSGDSSSCSTPAPGRRRVETPSRAGEPGSDVARQAERARRPPRRGSAANGMPAPRSTSVGRQLDADVGVDPALRRRERAQPAARAPGPRRGRAGAAASRRAAAPRRPGRRASTASSSTRDQQGQRRPAAWSPRPARTACSTVAVRRRARRRRSDHRRRRRADRPAVDERRAPARARRSRPQPRPRRRPGAGRSGDDAVGQVVPAEPPQVERLVAAHRLGAVGRDGQEPHVEVPGRHARASR